MPKKPQYEPKPVSVWIGRMTSSELTRYLRERSVDDEERAWTSGLREDMGGRFYDHDFLAGHHTGAPRPRDELREVLRLSYEDDAPGFADEVTKRLPQEPRGGFSCYVTIWNHVERSKPGAAFAAGKLTFLGSWEQLHRVPGTGAAPPVTMRRATHRPGRVCLWLGDLTRADVVELVRPRVSGDSGSSQLCAELGGSFGGLGLGWTTRAAPSTASSLLVALGYSRREYDFFHEAVNAVVSPCTRWTSALMMTGAEGSEDSTLVGGRLRWIGNFPIPSNVLVERAREQARARGAKPRGASR